jgi:hypothetical protein
LSSKIYGATAEEWAAFSKLFGSAILPSVCDPTVPVSENSAIQSALKIPSAISRSGHAYGMGAWTTHKATPAHIKAWSEDNRLGICAVTRDINAIDCDCSTPELTAFVVEYFALNIGQEIPLRVGKAGRGTLLVRVDSPEPLAKSKITLKNNGGIIEFLGSRQQTMLAGTHSSGVRYFYPDGLPTSVPTISLKEFHELWQALSEHLGTGESLNTDGVNERATGTALSLLDPFAQVLRDAGIVRAELGDKIAIECPWSHEHSGPSGLTASTYMMATTTQPANYRCLHGHCSGKNISHLHELFSFKTDDFGDVALVEPSAVVEAPASWRHDPRWVHKLDKNGDPYIDPNIKSNIQVALEYPELCDGLSLQYDTFAGTTTVWDNKGTKGYVPLADTHITRIYNVFNDHPNLKIKMGDRETNAQVGLYQTTHGVDCAMNALENIAPWDGVPRLKYFAREVLHAGKSQYAADVGVYMYLAITARIYLTDVSIDAIPVLIGKQKARKSRLVKALALVPEHYTKINFTDSDADKVRKMVGRSVINWDELSGVARSDINAIKSFITETKDTIVPKFSNKAVDIVRRGVMIGTTNDARFLIDPTGNRRFFPLTIGSAGIDLDKQEANKEQYYAEALHLIKQNPALIHDLYNRIDESHEAAVARSNATRISPSHKRIIDWLSSQDETETVYVSDMYELVMGTKQPKHMGMVEIGQSLMLIGYECVDLDTHCYKKILPNLE